ncbi:hypothetical protein GCM10022243_46100 [Saccharothrix violaceirubra]|uniref:Uncharacterized protein n=1 Tax=Saccharothrix violaceirubra TaxID=413306 RepID=A0A7W7T364_9PSEU|nr:hypothetical protein [Saccharothrix violaceirubra]MBB4964500.1 hypothetical protein [Saccharothrix violaceirubra]
MRTLLLLLLLLRFALHKKSPKPGPPPGGPRQPGKPSRQHGAVDAGAGMTSAQRATRDLEQEARPTGVTSDRDVHGRMRTGQRQVDVDHVWQNGEMYIQGDGQIVKVLPNGDGNTYSVVVRDMSNPSGAPTTVLDALTESQLQSRIDRGWWE